jgi:Skp family chaperone for outer membrane proteins
MNYLPIIIQFIVLIFTIAAAYWKVKNEINLINLKILHITSHYQSALADRIEQLFTDNKLSHESMQKLITDLEKTLIELKTKLDHIS